MKQMVERRTIVNKNGFTLLYISYSPLSHSFIFINVGDFGTNDTIYNFPATLDNTVPKDMIHLYELPFDFSFKHYHKYITDKIKDLEQENNELFIMALLGFAITAGNLIYSFF